MKYPQISYVAQNQGKRNNQRKWNVFANGIWPSYVVSGTISPLATLSPSLSPSIVSLWTSRTRGQLFDYGCMSNPDVLSSESGPHNEPMKGLFHLSLCLQSFSSLLFYRALVTAGRDCFSYLLPAALYSLAVTVRWYKYIDTFALRCAHNFSGAVGSMQKSHLITLWLTNVLFVLVYNEVCLVNRNSRSVIDAQGEDAQHTKTLDRLKPFEGSTLCMPVTFSTCPSLCLCDTIGDVDKKFA